MGFILRYSEFTDIIVRHLSVFQWCWESGEVPVEWKLANLPIVKHDKKDDPDNYRSISLTLVPGKIMEKVLGVTEKHLKDDAVTGHSHHRFTRESPA